MSQTVASRIDDELANELNQLARATNRSKSTLVEQALRSYVTSEQDFLDKVAAGLADIEAGRTTDHATVVAAMRRIYSPQK